MRPGQGHEVRPACCSIVHLIPGGDAADSYGRNVYLQADLLEIPFGTYVHTLVWHPMSSGLRRHR